MTHEIIGKEHIRLNVNFNELLSLRNLAKATRHDELCKELDTVISDLAERCRE